ncbi:winged helix-turn-helix domain-containing protein [Methylophilus sp. 14]|uniref:winged helix-turn-helix domain-containing protein n=1 Tax=Methylophilus sp. 14 TaxID=2781019 RepID=UPI00188F0920|nr:winged helix-turn-helix domain-containing protein [Methylophilus sp. 14]MBF4987572.1 winged helix-turn-helix domain-containing protein [Methylophilus sp. 14]
MSEQATLLLVEDDPGVYQFLLPALSAHGYRVQHARDLAQAREATGFAMVILDLGLPDGQGEQFIPHLRSYSDVPILVLSARQDELDKVHCLNLGADDYLMKPFGLQELLARVQVALRRTAIMQMRDHVYQHQALVINRASGMVTKHGEPLHLSPIEHALLMLLASKPGTIFTHSQLLAQVWGPDYIDDTHYLRIHIGRLRAKLEDQPATPQTLLTELGIGYRLA